MNSWPTTLPQRMQVQGYQSGLGDGRLRSENDTGKAKLRRRFSAIPRPLAGAMFMTQEQLAILQDFVRTTLSEGVLPFEFPAQGEPGTWIVQIGRSMPAWVPEGGLHWRVSLDLVILP